jgi:hypothetical protein
MAKLTKLQAVNRILRGASEAPVSSLEDSPLNENLMALQILEEYIISEQMHGIAWNQTSRRYTPNETTKRILLPKSTLFIEAWANSDHNDADRNVIEKLDKSDGQRYAFDVDNDTYEFEESIVLRVVDAKDWDELPVTVQFQIADAAAHMYQQVTQGDRQMDEILRGVAALSRAKGRAADWRSKRLNQFKDGRSNDPRRAARSVRRPW